MKKRIALILPCASWVKYKGDVKSIRTWKFILKKLKETKLIKKVDIFAIDCIRLNSTGKVIGIWSPFFDKEIMKEILTYNLDSYPSWEKFKKKKELLNELRENVKIKLKQISKKYDKIVCYVNVKGYFKVLASLSKEFNGKLEIIKLDHFSPFAFFYLPKRGTLHTFLASPQCKED